MIPSDSRRTSMRVMRTAEATVTMLQDESLNAKVNMNLTHIDLNILKVATPQAIQNAVPRWMCVWRSEESHENVSINLAIFAINLCITL